MKEFSNINRCPCLVCDKNQRLIIKRNSYVPLTCRYLVFQVNNENTRTMCEISSNLTTRTSLTSLTSFGCLIFNLEQIDFSRVCIVGFEQVDGGWVSKDRLTDFLKGSCSKSKGTFSLELLR